MQVLIVAPAQNDRAKLRYLISDICLQSVKIHEAENIKKGFQVVKSRSIDIVFLSLHLCDYQSLKLLKNLRNQEMKIIILSDEGTGIMTSPMKKRFDLLEKPIEREKVESIIYQYKLNIAIEISKKPVAKESEKQIAIKSNGETRIINIKHILRCQSDNNYTEIYLINGDKIVSSKTLKAYERILTESGFIRVHQSHLVAKQHIKKIIHTGATEVLLDNGEIIAVSRRKKEQLMVAVNAVSG